MIVASWNVNGVRAAAQRGLFDWLVAFAPDVLLLQETKARAEDIPKGGADVQGFVHRYHAAGRRGYSGVAVYARRPPDEWLEGVGDERFDGEGRVLFGRWGDLAVGSVYFPNSQELGRRIDYRLAFAEQFTARLDALRARGLGVIVGGDFNVAHQEIDIARPKQNEQNPGFLPAERAWMDGFLARGWVDTWRRRNPERKDVYSWWSYRYAARSKNIGWRLDYLCVDEATWPRVVGAEILGEITGSDHCPLTVELAE